MLAPWSLSQFAYASGAEVVFPHARDSVRDLYESSVSMRSAGRISGDREYINHDGEKGARYSV